MNKTEPEPPLFGCTASRRLKHPVKAQDGLTALKD
jgi:hypothetical protein